MDIDTNMDIAGMGYHPGRGTLIVSLNVGNSDSTGVCSGID